MSIDVAMRELTSDKGQYDKALVSTLEKILR